MFRGEYKEVKEILIKHDALDLDLDGIVDTGTELYEDLFGYYMESGEMPYDVMKARADVMPDEWIAERLEDLGLLETVLEEDGMGFQIRGFKGEHNGN